MSEERPVYAGANQPLWDRLRGKGYDVGDFYVQAGVGQTGAMIHVVINGVAMSFADAKALDNGTLTLHQITERAALRT